jgi:hypothetical protein
VVDAKGKDIKNEFAGQLADFSLLPHVKKGDNCTPPRIRPNISEDLVSKPFEATNDPLEMGVHLHWTLPPEFRRAHVSDPGGADGPTQPKPRFREVPNRWLIERRVFATGKSDKPVQYAQFNGKEIQPKTWLIEADALSGKKEKGSAAFPTKPQEFGYPEYKYLGKVYEYQGNYPIQRSPEAIVKDPIGYLDQLTAFGYGEPLFAAYYPESRNVFGFHDDLSLKVADSQDTYYLHQAVSGLEYEIRYIVAGWYEAPEKDPMTQANFPIWQDLEQLTDVQKPLVPKGIHPPDNRLMPFALLPEVDHGPGKSTEQFFWQVNLFKNTGVRYSKDKLAESLKRGLTKEVSDLKKTLKEKKGAIPEVKAHKENAKLVYKRNQELAKRELISQAELEASKASLDLIEKTLVDLDASVKSTQEKIDHKEAQLRGDIPLPADQEEEIRITKARDEGWKPFFDQFASQDYVNVDLPLAERPPVIRDEKLDALIRGRSILIGRVHKITWKGQGSSGASYEHDPQLKDASLVLANTPGQALSALLAKDEQEEVVLDALQLGLFSQQDQQDFPARLEAGLHESAFQAVPGGEFWTIRKLPTQSGESSLQPPTVGPSGAPPIPSTWALKLQFINSFQRSLNRQRYVIASEQEQFYADWYKYLLMQYDYTLDEITAEAHVNHVREYLSKEAHEFGYRFRELADYTTHIREVAKELDQLIQEWNQDPANRDQQFQLQTVPAPRYWEPREPAILLSGKDASPNQNYEKKEARTYVEFHQDLFISPDSTIPDKLLGFFHENYWNTIGQPIGEEISPYGFPSHHDGAADAWHPLFMEWQVDVFPFTKPGDKDFNQKDWPSDSVVAHYNLPEHQPDLRLQNNLTTENKVYQDWLRNNTDLQIQGGKRLQTIEGRSILTGGVFRPLIEHLENLIEQEYDGIIAEKEEALTQLESALNASKEASIQDLQNTIDRLKTTKRKQLKLAKSYKEMDILSQSLSGFNDALLMRKQILQLPVKDPLAKTDVLHRFAEEMAQTIGKGNNVAPLPSNMFLPLREGPLRIRQIRLVDVWGRTKTLDYSDLQTKVKVATPMQPPKEIAAAPSDPKEIEYCRGLAYLPPRVVQPIRLNFRWISAERGEEESGQFAADSPICGYIVPNFLDNSLHVFNASGQGLAVLARSGDRLALNPFPGKNEVSEKAFNYHLWQFTQSVKEHGLDYMTGILKAAQRSIPATQPSNFAQFDGTPLLMGRPLALVRATMNLELRGNPAVNNSWNAREAVYMKQELHVTPTMGFDKLRFALRIGNAFQAEDGCLAYFIDRGESRVDELFTDYLDQKPRDTEEYWNNLAHHRKWKAIFEERIKNREAEIDKLSVQNKGLEGRKLNPREGDDLDQINSMIAQRKDRIDFLQNELEEAQSAKITHEDAIYQLELEIGHQSDPPTPGIFKPHSDLLTLSLEEDPLTIGLLMDPRAAVHLTTGILPVKQIDIPAEQFADALNNIQIAFLTTPIISPKPPVLEDNPVGETPEDQETQPATPLFLVTPKMTGYQWAWWQRINREDWAEVPPEQIQQPPAGFTDDFKPQTIFEGWMKLLPEDK